MENVKKYVIAGVIVAAGAAYYLFANTGNKGGQMADTTAQATTPSATATTSTATATNSTTAAGVNAGAGSPAVGSGTAGEYKDGVYTGSVADAFYGNLQVQVTVSGGRITDIAFLQYPQGGHSTDVSMAALPILAKEGVQAQSGNVNVVSGATQDWEAFGQTMAAALAQAKA